MESRLYTFAGGSTGEWGVTLMRAVVGEPLPVVERVSVLSGGVVAVAADALWSLRGVTSNARYTTREEKAALSATPNVMGRSEATRAALIPIRKNAAWWELAQDERRAILEDRSHHIRTGLQYIPEIARRLLYSRDLGSPEPFDFLGWLEYAPEQSAALEDLVGTLRATEEWKFVDREVDIRLSLDHGRH